MHTEPLKQTTVGSIRCALDHMIYTTTAKQPLPVENLLVVDIYLRENMLPDVAHLREFALREILTEIVCDQVTRQLPLHNLPEIPSFRSRYEIMEFISKLGSTGNPDLIGWSWLYFRFIRAELNISPGEFSEMIIVDDRTLRRYQSYAIQRIYETLIRLEMHYRRKYRIKHLKKALPPNTFIRPLIGRETLLSPLLTLLSDKSFHRVLIAGFPGIGKTRFVAEVVKRLVEEETIQRVFWIDTSHELHLLLQETLEPNTLLILDDVPEKEPVKQVITQFPETSLIVIGPWQDQFLEFDHIFRLKELDLRSSLQLILYEAARYWSEDEGMMTENEARAIYAEVGGHPKRIIEAVQHHMRLPAFV